MWADWDAGEAQKEQPVVTKNEGRVHDKFEGESVMALFDQEMLQTEAESVGPSSFWWRKHPQGTSSVRIRGFFLSKTIENQ